MRRCKGTFAWALAVALSATTAGAQELTPRTYWPAPTGTRVAVLAYSLSYGDVYFDPSIPLNGVDSTINSGVLAYMQTLAIKGRTANLLLELPYAWGDTGGLILNQSAQTDVSGFGDFGVTLTVNLRGAPAMTPLEFHLLRTAPRPILGASIKVLFPTGQYESNRLINVGANRWAVRAQVGSILPLAPKWLLESSVGVWFFGDDAEFVTGRKEQDPVLGIPMHLVRRIRPGFWASLDVTYFSGGRQTIGGNQLDDAQSNLKIGGTLMIPLKGHNSLKLSYADGSVTKYGTDFDQILLSYFYIW